MSNVFSVGRVCLHLTLYYCLEFLILLQNVIVRIRIRIVVVVTRNDTQCHNRLLEKTGGRTGGTMIRTGGTMIRTGGKQGKNRGKTGGSRVLLTVNEAHMSRFCSAKNRG